MTPAEEHVAFYHQVGLAVDQWGMVEYGLFEVVSSCFDRDQRRMAARGFFSIENFRSKLKYADEVLKVHMSAEHHLARWVVILARLQSASGKRNRIVHGRVIVHSMSQAGRRYALVPWDAPSGSGRPPPGSLCLRDVAAFTSDFSSLFVSLSRFCDSLNGRRAHLPESGERPRDPPTIPQIRAQIHAILGHPAKSSRKKSK